MPGNLEGRIVNSRSKEPVARVRVICMGKITETDPRGFFRLEGIPAGTQYVLIEKLEYPVEQKMIVIEEGKTTIQDFSIEPILKG